MKRVLQGLAVLQLFLLVALGVRAVRVWSTPLPEFGDIPELPASSSVPPAKPPAKVSSAVTDAIVDHDLFDEARGQNKQDIPIDGITVEEPPVPPPATVKLVGVMRIGDSPVGILVDTSVKPDQQSVRKGDMFGEYEVGDIQANSLILLGGAGQQFQIPLRLEAGGGAGAAPTAPGVAPHPGVAPGAVHPVTAAKPAPRPAVPAPNASANDSKTQTARERAQAIAQRNADLRKAGAPNPGGPGAEGAQNQGSAAPDPVQARLESLRALREAAKAH